MLSIDKINQLPKDNFIKIFGNVFEKTIWIAERVFAYRPFDNYNQLSDKFLHIYENENKENHLIILNSHPELAIEKIMTKESQKEQVGADLNNCTKEEIEEFTSLNKNYKKKFNFPFIIAVSDKNKFEILDNFRLRINNDKNTEFKEAVKQVKKIAYLRLKRINNE